MVKTSTKETVRKEQNIPEREEVKKKNKKREEVDVESEEDVLQSEEVKKKKKKKKKRKEENVESKEDIPESEEVKKKKKKKKRKEEHMESEEEPQQPAAKKKKVKMNTKTKMRKKRLKKLNRKQPGIGSVRRAPHGTKQKAVSTNYLFDKVPLTPNQTLTVNALKSTTSTDFPIENDSKCPQQDGQKVDCGYFLMYFMQTIARGEEFGDFGPIQLFRFKVDIIEKLVNHTKWSWTV